mmetsp:Transcript_64396/g.179022  ORF Transcript_64396/g.179022 Transcript_64396/m.179022 type:complete len:206 (-) Transcript_64396:892-1509(-)
MDQEESCLRSPLFLNKDSNPTTPCFLSSGRRQCRRLRCWSPTAAGSARGSRARKSHGWRPDRCALHEPFGHKAHRCRDKDNSSGCAATSFRPRAKRRGRRAPRPVYHEWGRARRGGRRARSAPKTGQATSRHRAVASRMRSTDLVGARGRIVRPHLPQRRSKGIRPCDGLRNEDPKWRRKGRPVLRKRGPTRATPGRLQEKERRR